MQLKLIHETDTPYGRHSVVERIYNERPARVLFSDGGVAQSGIALDDDPTPLFEYNQRFLEIVMSIQPKRILIIGGGAFTLPTQIARLSSASIDVVELNPSLEPIAKRFFGLKTSKNLRVHVGDGIHFLQNSSQKYDLIIVDAFSGRIIPPQLMNHDAAHIYSDHLSPNGIIALNCISRYHTANHTLLNDLTHSLQAHFNAITVYPADHEIGKRETQNLIVVGARRVLPALDYVQSSAVLTILK